MKQVPIDLGLQVYNAFRSLPYKYWYAISEFIDNSIQSYQDNRTTLNKMHGDDFILNVEIEIIPNSKITIADNAGGIPINRFEKAFRPGELPDNRQGLNEFGMGMKVASVWLGNRYRVKTTCVGDAKSREVEFDLSKLDDENPNLTVNETDIDLNSHYTIIEIDGLSENAPNSSQKIRHLKSHLADIYRLQFRENRLVLKVNGEKIKYIEPEILIAREQNNKGEEMGELINWRHDFDIQIPNTSNRVKGFVALLKEMNSKRNGFSIFRRGRVINGSHDEKYYPQIICGQTGSPLYKRLFGELELYGEFKVSFDKGSFTNMQQIENILRLVKLESNKIINQGRNYRVKNDGGKEFNIVDDNSIVSQSINEYRQVEIFNDITRQNSEITNSSFNEQLNRVEVPKEFKLELGTIFKGEIEENGSIKYDIVLENRGVQFSDFLRYSESPEGNYTAFLNLDAPFGKQFQRIFKENKEHGDLVLTLVKSAIMADIIVCKNQSQAHLYRYYFNNMLTDNCNGNN